MISFRAFRDELEKIAVKLTDRERAIQTGTFAGLGAVAAPAIGGVANLIQHGKVSPFTTPKRWLAGSALTGAVAGGVMPSIRHGIEREMQDVARERRRQERLATQ